VVWWYEVGCTTKSNSKIESIRILLHIELDTLDRVTQSAL